MSDTTTNGIRIQVKPEYWAEKSKPEFGEFAFMYTVRIENVGAVPARLVSRHWLISDATGKIEEVRGEGVVGKQPSLGPDEAFEYTSWAMLKTPFGSMRGSYQMVREDGSQFDAKIGEFALTLPHALN